MYYLEKLPNNYEILTIIDDPEVIFNIVKRNLPSVLAKIISDYFTTGRYLIRVHNTCFPRNYADFWFLYSIPYHIDPSTSTLQKYGITKKYIRDTRYYGKLLKEALRNEETEGDKYKRLMSVETCSNE